MLQMSYMKIVKTAAQHVNLNLHPLYTQHLLSLSVIVTVKSFGAAAITVAVLTMENVADSLGS